MKIINKKQNDFLSGTVFPAIFVLIAALIITSTIWSIRATANNVDETVTSLNTFYLEELVYKRELVLEDSINHDFENLNRVISLLKSKNINDQETLRSFLLDAQTLYGVKRLAIVDENNTIYTAHSTFSDASRYSFVQNTSKEQQIITSNLYGAKKQVVLMVPVENVNLHNAKIVSCFMQIDIDDVAGSLTYEDEGEGKNIFIGLYYKNGDNLTTSKFGELDPGQNLLKYIHSTMQDDEQNFDEISQNFRSGEQGIVTINTDDEEKYIYYIPVKGTDWMLTVMVYDNTIADKLEYTSAIMLRRNIILLVLTAALIVSIFLIVYFLNRKNTQMLIRQQELEVRAQNEEELRIAHDEAQRANKAKSDFLFNMSHDIRTPMNAIIGFSKIMENELDKPAQLKNHLHKLQDSSSYLLSIINNILDMARIESGKTELNIELVDLLDKSSNVFDMFITDLEKKELHFTSSENITHRYVFADMQKLRQITSNLISNSIKYTPPGGSIAVHLEELPNDTPDYGTYELTVSDTGIGMSEEFRMHIFESFSRERTSTENNVIGTGLGMAIAKSLVEMQGGTISVDSEIGKGSKFTVVIPFKLAQSQEEYILKQASPDNIDSSKLAGKRILLAEDNDINAEIATEILKGFGLNIERAEDGVVCVDMLSKAEPGYYDCILMDIQMPNMNGYKATESIRHLQDKDKAGIPIIAMTANAFEEDKNNAFKSGMDGHLSKPIDTVALVKTLVEFL